MTEVAKRLNISPQNLQNRFKSKEITLDFLIEVSKAVNASVYYFIKGTAYENEFLQPDNVILKEPDGEFIPNVVDAKNQTIEILQREVQDLRSDKDFLKRLSIQIWSRGILTLILNRHKLFLLCLISVILRNPF
ncbi:hypothetical protein H9W95_06695 [Flavobacterium lindanitolerans]|nr:hypothetical protein [Flavobacterium lindanitolerans]